MSSPSFLKMATITTASTKRSPMTGAIRGTPATNLSNITCTPLDPVDPETRTQLKLDSGFEVKETFVDASLDIKEGDVLVVASVSYDIRSVAEWSWRGAQYLRLIVIQNKG